MQAQWFRLDNAALIFPAVMRRGWSNAFRLSATLTEPVDPALLRQAAEALRERFPSFFVRLRAGMFWYRLERDDEPVRVCADYAYPLTHMPRAALRRSCLRILCFENRIAVEFFHAVTDGSGGMVFLLNLTAAYLTLKYGVAIPAEGQLVRLSDGARPEELEDSFQRCCGPRPLRSGGETAYRLHGNAEPDGFRHLITGIADTENLHAAASAQGVSITAFLAAVMAEAVISMQAEALPERAWRPVRITVPVNLRRLFGSATLRNFSLTLDLGVDPRLGSYTLGELCRQISHQMQAEAVPQRMAGRIAENVTPQRNPLLRVTPLLVKTPVMRAVYAARGEKGGCLNISNLGAVTVPDAMAAYLRRLEFIVGVQLTYPNNCAVVSYGGKTYINMIRSIRESELERRFFSRLVALGVPIEIESNRR